MIRLVNLNQQHSRIKEEVKILESEIIKGVEEMNISELALHINILAGQIKVHLLEEDEFLYPSLLKSNDAQISGMAKEYIEEMGDLFGAYTNFKMKYNIGNKIKADKDKFLEEIQIVLKALKERITKEENELYHIIQNKSL